MTQPRTGSSKSSAKSGPTTKSKAKDDKRIADDVETILQPCKSGRPRKGKVTITEARLRLRANGWERVKSLLRTHLQSCPKGEQHRMAEEIGIADSQLHRFACEACNHDQEPSFSVGIAILLYISGRRNIQDIEQIPNLTHPQYNEKNKTTAI